MLFKRSLFGYFPLLLVFLLMLCGMKCKKEKAENEHLPAITQSGAHTFGFKLNDKVWVPRGNSMYPLLHLSIDFSNSGSFTIDAQRTISETGPTRELIFIGLREGLNNYNAPFTIDLSNRTLARLQFQGVCNYDYRDQDVNISGGLTVTKLDRDKKIIAGTFYAVISKKDCETINITDGRFDLDMSKQ